MNWENIVEAPPPDEGCEASPSCLSCHLPQCRYDDPMWYKAYKRDLRHAVIREVLQASASTYDAARKLGISSRTVHRAMHGPPNGHDQIPRRTA